MAQGISPRLAAYCALWLFLRTFRQKLRAEDAAILGQAKLWRIAVSKGSIAAWEWAGSGPTAIILHGWGSGAARFTPLAQALHARGWRVIAFDAPGHGASSGRHSSLPQFMAALDAVIAHFGPPQALIGHSLGALAIACRHQAGVPDWAGGLRAVVLISMPSGAEFLLGKYIEALRLSAATERHLRARFRARFQAEPSGYAALPGAGRIAARVLLLHDPDDDIVPYAHSTGLLTQLRGAQLVTTGDQGHSKLTRDAATIARIADFLA